MNTSTPKRIIRENPDDLNRHTADLLLEWSNKAIEAAGRFTIALSGGSTPRSLYSLLATEPYRTKFAWQQIHLFWGDERFVPLDHPDSNYRMVKQALLDSISIPSQNVHHVPVEISHPQIAARKYQEELIDFFNVAQGQFPSFDLILLGLGEDGHTASLFPGTSALNVEDSLVVANYVDKLSAFRITFTFPLINNAHRVAFLLAGQSKAEMVKRILQPDPNTEPLPSQMVRPTHGELLFLMDRPAASAL